MQACKHNGQAKIARKRWMKKAATKLWSVVSYTQSFVAQLQAINFEFCWNNNYLEYFRNSQQSMDVLYVRVKWTRVRSRAQLADLIFSIVVVAAAAWTEYIQQIHQRSCTQRIHYIIICIGIISSGVMETAELDIL